MPLIVDSQPHVDQISSIQQFLMKYPNLKAEAEKLKSITPVDIPPHGLLYVNQREYAVVSRNTDGIKVMGSEDATTCHIVVIRHSGSGVTGLAHCDGYDTKRGLQNMIHLINTLSGSCSDGRLEVTLIGGFNDDQRKSERLSLEVIGILQGCSECLHLVCACVTDYNNVLKNGKNFPMIYGIAVDIDSGHVYPARFPDKGPEINVRSACHFGGLKDLINIYDHKQSHLVIGPYTWQPMEKVHLWLQAPDRAIRKYLSTSPEQEPAYFENHVREALKVLCDHPDPSQTLFADGKAHRYKMNKNGIWVNISDM